MALRLIQVFLSSELAEQIPEVVDQGCQEPCLGLWRDQIEEGLVLTQLLVNSEATEKILDLLSSHFSSRPEFRIILLPVEATLPRPPVAEEEDQQRPPANRGQDEAPEQEAARISREELYADVSESVNLTRTYLILVGLSSIVAAIGLLRSDVAVLIGAMVIAPLLGPNVATSLATALGDLPLGRRALKVNSVGLVVALAVALAAGFSLPVEPSIPELAARTQPGLSDIVLALTAGAAGALSFTMGVPTALVGVMVAVALLPPLVAFGMLLGAGLLQPALGALLLTVTNIICVNLAGVVTFALQGIHPAHWWEMNRARRAIRLALLVWLALLALLIVFFVVTR